MLHAEPDPGAPRATRGITPAGLRPLRAVAAAGAGGVPQARIQRLFADILPDLASRHSQGRAHGAISMDTVALDASGRAYLLDEAALYGSASSRVADPAAAVPQADIFGLSALAHVLITGTSARAVHTPGVPRASARAEFQPLRDSGRPGYQRAFLEAIDAGLGLHPAWRFAGLADFARRLGIVPDSGTPGQPFGQIMPATKPPARAAADALPGDADGAVLQEPLAAPPRRRWPTLARGALLLMCMLVAAWWWQRSVRPPTALALGPGAASAAAPAIDAGPLALPSREVAPGGSEARSVSTPATSPGTSSLGASESASEGPSAAGPAPVRAALVDTTAHAPGSAGQARAAARTVTVVLDISPWGEVIVDGVVRGVSPPLKSLALAPGSHRVEVRNADLPPYRTTLEVLPGSAPVLTHQFR